MQWYGRTYSAYHLCYPSCIIQWYGGTYSAYHLSYHQRRVELPYMSKRSYGHMALGNNGGVNRVFFSRSYSVISPWVSSFWRTWAWFATRCRVTPEVVIWPGALIQQLPTVLHGDVQGRLLKPKALSRRLLGMAHGFSSHLTFQEVLYLTYDIVRRVPARQIQQDYSFSSKTIADWGKFCRETMLVYTEGCSDKNGGTNKTVEIDESMFGRRKYNRGHPVNP
jgi:hypothetical protein